MPTPHELLTRLESRHDELLDKLDELDVQVEQALAQFARSREPSTSDEPPAKAVTEFGVAAE